MAPPGTYTLRLTVNGRSYTQPVTVRKDPRSPATIADLQAQHALQMKIMKGLQISWDAYQQVAAVRRSAQQMVAPDAPADVKAALATFEAAIDSVAGDTAIASQFSLAGGPAPAPKFVDVNVALVSQLKAQDYADQAPTPAMIAGWKAACEALGTALRQWQRVSTSDVNAFGKALGRSDIVAVISPPKAPPAPTC